MRLAKAGPYTNAEFNIPTSHYWGYAMAQLVEALRYKLEGLGSIPDGVIGIFH
jgi:hypothetical protein